MASVSWKIVRDIDPDSTTNIGLHENEYKKRHTCVYNLIQLKTKYQSLLLTEKDKLENRAYNGKCNELEAEYKKACLSKESRIKKHEATLETLKHKYELAVEKEMIEFESALQYWEGQEKCFDSKLKQEKKKQDFEIFPVNVKKAQREYEDALKNYPYKYKPLDIYVEPPEDYIQYICLPPPISQADEDLKTERQEAIWSEKQREKEEEEQKEIEREKALKRRAIEVAEEEQRQTEKRKKELEAREHIITTPPPEYTIDELLDFLEQDIDALLHSKTPEMRKKIEKSLSDTKKQLEKQGMLQHELQKKEQEIYESLGSSLEQMRLENSKPITEEQLLQNREAYFKSLRNTIPPPIAPKKPIIKKPKREEQIKESLHTYGSPCA